MVRLEMLVERCFRQTHVVGIGEAECYLMARRLGFWEGLGERFLFTK